MKKATVQDTVTEYLEQFNRRGFLYVPSQPGDSRQIMAMQKKAIEIGVLQALTIQRMILCGGC